MKIKGEFVLREIAGDTLLIPVGQTALHMNGMITLDPVAALIWRGVEDGKNEDEILNAILDEFDVERDVAKQDLSEFLLQMREKHFLED